MEQEDFCPILSYKVSDMVIGVLYLICFAWGVPSNLLALYFFTRKKFKSMDIPSFLYTLTALNDTMTSLLVLVSGVTMLQCRDVFLPALCPTHHIIFQMTQRMSVFLVSILSTTRTYILCFPLRQVNVRTIQLLTAVLFILMSSFFIVPPLSGLVHIGYHYEGGYCWASPVPGYNASYTWDTLDNVMDTIGLAFPVLPITLSCVISIHKIVAARKAKTKLVARRLSKTSAKGGGRSQKTNRRATFTIILLTLLYIVSNIPLFCNYVLYTVTVLYYQYPEPFYSSGTMYFYSWNVTAILSTGLNASANPIVYITRFKRFRVWLLKGCRTKNFLFDHTTSELPTRMTTFRRTAVVSRQFSRLKLATKLERRLNVRINTVMLTSRSDSSVIVKTVANRTNSVSSAI